MFAKRLWVAVVTVVTVLAASAVAQEGKNEVGGAIGRIFISDQGITGATYFDPIIHSGMGLTVEGQYARRLFVAPAFSLSGEAVVVYNPDENLNAGSTGNAVVPTHYQQLFFTPAARLNLFPATAVSPWLSFGGGFAHFSQSSTLDYGGPNPGKNTTSGVLQAGLGLDVRAWRKLSLRGQFRDFWSGEPDFPLAPTGKTRQHNYFVALGAFWRF